MIVEAQPTTVETVIREARPDEHRWVQATWSRCARIDPTRTFDKVPIGGMLWLDPKLVKRAHHRLVDDLMSSCRVIVATLLVDPDPIGWAAFDGPVLHFVFVAPAARRCSVARQLVLHTRCSTASHVTTEGVRLLRCLSGSQD